ncbi:MAG: YaeQ family protein [Bdellovibrionaceae bacterium]|nr:YaeQ family protein [Pseudobdellovibrionaceae bacterium]
MLYHFQFDLSDVDRGIYESLDFRLYQHPSEIMAYLLTRALAYALSYTDGLQFSDEGLSDPEMPAMRAMGLHGATDVWIEIGNPSTRKLHKATKAARRVVVYTYKSADVLIDEISKNSVHRADEIEIYSLDMNFLNLLETLVKSNNHWSVLVQQGQLYVGIRSQTVSTEVKKYRLK